MILWKHYTCLLSYSYVKLVLRDITYYDHMKGFIKERDLRKESVFFSETKITISISFIEDQFFILLFNLLSIYSTLIKIKGWELRRIKETDAR